MAHNPRSTDWCFTSFLPDPPTYDVEDQVYLVYQREVCPDTGREHWQGFVIFKYAKSISASQANLGCPGSHHEKRRGSRKQASDYCQKEDTRKPETVCRVFGELPAERGQGHRSDLEGVVEAVQAGHSRAAIAAGHPMQFIKYHRGIDALLAATRLQPRDRQQAPSVRVYVGPPGCGKTRSVYDEFKSVYSKDPESVWWDNYWGEECVLIDDFYGGISLPHILRVTDRYPIQGQNKGGHVEISRSTTTFIFTSNKEPEEWWGQFVDIGAFRRRVTVTRRFQLAEAADPAPPGGDYPYDNAGVIDLSQDDHGGLLPDFMHL